MISINRPLELAGGQNRPIYTAAMTVYAVCLAAAAGKAWNTASDDSARGKRRSSV